MANYCANYVELVGKSKVLDQIQMRFENRKNYSSFNESMADLLDHKLEEEEKEDIYLFSTKWWRFEVERKTDNLLLLTGDSAWSPPTNLIVNVAAKWDINAYIEYQDWQGDVNGAFKFSGKEEVLKIRCSNEEIDKLNFKHIQTVTLTPADNYLVDVRISKEDLDLLEDLAYKNWRDLSDRERSENVSGERMRAEELWRTIQEAKLAEIKELLPF